MKRYRTFLSFIFCSIFFLLQICNASDDSFLNYSTLFKDMRSGIVHIGLISSESKPENIIIEKWLGTGFLVDSESTFITAKHVLKNIDKEKIAIRFQLPSDLLKVRTLKADLIYQDDKKDLAVLKIFQFKKKPYKSGELHIFPLLEKENIKSLVGEEIVIIGYPVIANKNIDIPIIRNGIISSNEIEWPSGTMLLLDLLGVPGFSGSPVILRKSGHVVGVVFGPGPTQRAFGFEWATPFYKGDYDRIMPQTINDVKTD